MKIKDIEVGDHVAYNGSRYKVLGTEKAQVGYLWQNRYRTKVCIHLLNDDGSECSPGHSVLVESRDLEPWAGYESRRDTLRKWFQKAEEEEAARTSQYHQALSVIAPLVGVSKEEAETLIPLRDGKVCMTTGQCLLLSRAVEKLQKTICSHD